MAKIPEFLLRSLYVKGSLGNREGGFEFQVKNELGPARIIGAHALKLDRRPIPLENCQFIYGDKRASFGDITVDNSLLMHKGEALIVVVEGTSLDHGRHSLGISLTIKDIGAINFTVSDRIT